MKNECSKCKKEVERHKYLKKIRGLYYCKQCAVELRKKHRKETLENSEELERIKELDRIRNKKYNDRRYQKVKKERNTTPPKIKGSREEKKEKYSNCYLTVEDRRNLFRILIKRGLGEEEAIERINNLKEEQKRIRMEMRIDGKSKEEIKIKQNELLEELWNY